jgi:hypothetical protein
MAEPVPPLPGVLCACVTAANPIIAIREKSIFFIIRSDLRGKLSFLTQTGPRKSANNAGMELFAP